MLPKIVLASSSPARKMLLERLQIPFETHAPNIDETPLLGETPEQLVTRLTQEKGRAVAKKFPEALIISSDQVIIVKGQVISKPETKEAAVVQLQEESGEWVESLTGLGLLNAKTNEYQYACVKTRVLFRELTQAMIDDYLAKDPQAIYCAGSLRVEALGIILLKKIESDDPTALIGLPLITLTEMLNSTTAL
ncbi:MAG: septum formation inhibitor Maf [Gammaproteobacteria bacterium]|jgi:septum formation protein|nr:septum formation inhibitor Maf [Gammaproteobacteria bacterium]